MTVSDLIYTGLRLAGVLGRPRRTASPSELAEGLDVLNAMLDAWNIERLMVYTTPRSVWNVQANQQTYTIGPGGDFDTARPPRIERAGYLWLANPAQPLEQPMEVLTLEQWQAVPLKTLASTLCTKLYYQPDFPLGKIILWPAPTVSNQLALYNWQLTSAFASLEDPVAFPPGYQNALEYNLALELIPRYPGRSTRDPLVIERAADTKARIKSLNAPTLEMRCDAALSSPSGRWNWYTGEYQK
ncbi:MAG TPA: hypothetical protein VFA33_07545 [Bryobacteraceae bacterium]|nr:hypothetical protein [Bryobacteraceae bacterium]